jgi:glycosyltransferase involved in cell wall biosynthesis
MLEQRILPVSIVIRARNEGANLQRLFPLLAAQTVPHEIILVNNASTDHTRQVASDYGANVIDIARDEFNYPKASNLGVRAATGTDIVLLSAHSFPRRPDWLARGLVHLDNPEVAGVYSKPITRRDQDASRTDRLFSYLGAGALRLQHIRYESEFVASRGQMGSTNALYRGELLRGNLFDETRGSGGEDIAWAKAMLECEFTIVRDPAFAVYHSHGLGPRGWIKQYQEWAETTGDPRPFNREKIVYRRGAQD